LDTDKRNIFIKRYWYSQPVKVISKELGKSESSVKVALHRLRKDLKKLLESEGVLV
jgi:RNA polymerase sigma-70 factor (ECF subfamily)